MEISGLTQAGAALLDALEKTGTSPGAELRSPSGPGGLPSAELVQAFEAALNEPQAVGNAENTQSVETPSASIAPAREAMSDVNTAEAVFRPVGVDVVEGAHEPSASVLALQEAFADVASGTLSHEDLYRLQYSAGMLKIQGSSGKGLSQEASQGLESLLRQQG